MKRGQETKTVKDNDKRNDAVFNNQIGAYPKKKKKKKTQECTLLFGEVTTGPMSLNILL